MSWRPHPVTRAAREEVEADPACDVFYLRTEAHGNGYRWSIAKFGTAKPMIADPSVFHTDHAAKQAGRAALEQFLARQNSWSPARHPL